MRLRWDGRGGRPRTALLAPLALFLLTGCATKRDVRDLRDEIIALRAHQDSTMAALQRQSRAVSDSVAATGDVLMRMRGDFVNALAQLEQQHLQIQELTGQSQRRLSELREQMAERNARMTAPIPTDSTGAAVAAAAGGEAADLYASARENLERGATSTARMAFEQIVQQYPDDPLAADAQLGLAETYYQDQDPERAMRELERVVEMFPGSPRAPTALYRAGVIAQERGNTQKAREYFRRVVAGYPKSDEARMAAEQLRPR